MTRLTSITIPHSVQHIGSYAFAGCSNLTSIYFSNNTNLDRLNYSDLSYEDMILFQLEMILSLAQRESDKNAIVFCTIPVITTRISEFLMKCSDENLYLVVETRDVSKCSLLEVLVCSRLYADLANEELLLDIIMDLPFHIQKNELLEQINLIITLDDNLNAT